jgi:hypothetical protein
MVRAQRLITHEQQPQQLTPTSKLHHLYSLITVSWERREDIRLSNLSTQLHPWPAGRSFNQPLQDFIKRRHSSDLKEKGFLSQRMSVCFRGLYTSFATEFIVNRGE